MATIRQVALLRPRRDGLAIVCDTSIRVEQDAISTQHCCVAAAALFDAL